MIDGPLGTLGVPLLARRTIAVDPRAIPLGRSGVSSPRRMPLSDAPLDAARAGAGHRRRRSAAPCAPIIFWGFGAEAGREAGRMRQDGRMWLLWPKAPTPRALADSP